MTNKLIIAIITATLTLLPAATISSVVYAAPEAPQLIGTAGDRVNTLTWNQPSGASGSITYTLKVGSTTIYTGTELTYRHTPLTNGTNYTYTVVAADTSTTPNSQSSNTVTLKPSADQSGNMLGYILDSSQAKHLQSQRWCITNDKPWTTALSTCDTGGGAIQAFNKSTSSYVMFEQHQQGGTINCSNATFPYKTNRFTMYVAEQGKRISLYKANGQYYFTSNGLLTKVEVRAEPNSDPDYKCNWTGSFATGQFQISVQQSTYPSTINGGLGFLIGNDIYAAVVSGVNVDYSSSWDAGRFTNRAITASDDGLGDPACNKFDLSCHLSNLSAGFNRGVREMVGLIGDMFKFLWVPDSDSIQNQFNETTETLKTKLGFLFYPVTFTANLFTAMQGNGGQACNNSQCQLTFGTWFGAPLAADIGALKSTAPAIWTWLQLILQGVTAVGFIFMVRKKLMGVIQR
jgi:hypothetical protein